MIVFYIISVNCIICSLCHSQLISHCFFSSWFCLDIQQVRTPLLIFHSVSSSLHQKFILLLLHGLLGLFPSCFPQMSFSSSSFCPYFSLPIIPCSLFGLTLSFCFPRFLTPASPLCARVRWMIIITLRVFKPSTFYLQVCPMPHFTHSFSLGWRCTQRFQRPRHWSLVSMTVIMYT